MLTPGNNIHERQVSGDRLAARYDLDREGFRALQRTKASDGGTRVGSGTELWGFVFWLGREAAVQQAQSRRGKRSALICDCYAVAGGSSLCPIQSKTVENRGLFRMSKSASPRLKKSCGQIDLSH